MTAAVPTNEPPEGRAGLSWAWKRTLSDFPASIWTLKYWFKKTGATQANFSIQASASGDDFSVAVAATTTAAYTAGDYTWAAEVTSGVEAYEVDRGRMRILARYDQAANYDDRSHARKVLEALEAVIESKATTDQLEYTIGSRHIKKMTPQEILFFRDRYRSEVANEDMAERARNGLGGNRYVAKL